MSSSRLQKNIGGDHARLLTQIYKHLKKSCHLPVDWIADQVKRLERIDGDIDTLVGRIAGIRIWTYVSHQGKWLEDANHWQEKTREVEDDLSDALHRGLTQRFVDQRAATLVKSLKSRQILCAAVDGDGDVMVEGHFVGKLKGFKFVADSTDGEIAGKTVTVAALKALGREIARRTYMLLTDADDKISLTSEGKLVWRGDSVARLIKGKNPLAPEILLIPDNLLEQPVRQKIQKRLHKWLASKIELVLRPLQKIKRASLEGAARGIVFQFVEGLGVLPKRNVGNQMLVLKKGDYGTFRRIGLKIGRQEIFMPALLRPKTAALTALLWAVFQELEVIPSPPPPGRVSIPVHPDVPLGFYLAAGFRRKGPMLLRVDILERLIGQIRRRLAKGPFVADAELLNLAGCTSDEMDGVLGALGFHGTLKKGKTVYKRALRNASRKKNFGITGKALSVPLDEASPFAKLKDLSVGS